MFFDPDKFDAIIVICKFLAVFSSGMLAGEALYVSRTHSSTLLAMRNVDKASHSFGYFWPKGLHMYQTTLVSSFAGFAVFLLETRERVYWLYGAVGLLLIFLYTKFYLFPKAIHHLLDPDFSKKGESYIYDMVARFHCGHQPRTVLSAALFFWYTYSLYTS